MAFIRLAIWRRCREKEVVLLVVFVTSSTFLALILPAFLAYYHIPITSILSIVNLGNRGERGMAQCACNREPTLADMLEDPIVRLLMARDGIARPELEKLMSGMVVGPAAQRMQSEQCGCVSMQERPHRDCR